MAALGISVGTLFGLIVGLGLINLLNIYPLGLFLVTISRNIFLFEIKLGYFKTWRN